MRRTGSYVAAAVLAVLGAEPALAQEMPMAVDDRTIYSYVLLDELEYLPGAQERPIEFDGLAWFGGDFNRVWLKARGKQSTRARDGRLEGQLLYGRVIAPFWDAQVGLGVDARYGDGDGRTRSLLAVGLQGLAPYWFEVETTLFVSQDGHVSARLQGSYDLLFTQRLILQPDLELNLAAQDVPEFGVRSGLSDVEASVRLRYEIVRELAPYIGISWSRRRGESGRSGSGGAGLVAGLRWWY